MQFANLTGKKIHGSFYGPDDPATPATPGTPAPVAAPVVSPKTYNDEEVNKIIAKEKQKWQDSTKTIHQQLTELQQSKTLTEEEKAALSKQLDELQLTFQTKDQQAQTALQKLQEKYESDTKTLKEAQDSWKGRFESNMKLVDISNAASKHKAFSPRQIEALLKESTRVVEDLDEEQHPSGTFTTVVEFSDKDKDGKPIKLKLSVEDAVKRMSEMPEYANLFQNEATSGLNMGQNRGAGNGRLPDIESMSPAEYAKNREKIHAEMAKANG